MRPPTFVTAFSVDQLLPERMSTSRRLLSNFSFLLAADVIVKGVSLVTVAYYSRVLGPEGLGELSVVTTMVNYFALVSTWGYLYYGLNELGRDPARAQDVVSSLVCLRTFLSLICFVALVAVVRVRIATQHMRVLYWIMGLTIITGGLSMDWAFQGFEKLRVVALFRVMTACVFSAVSCGLVYARAIPENLVWNIALATVLSQIIADLYLWLLYRATSIGFRWTFEPARWCALYKRYFLTGTIGLLANLFLTLDLVLIGHWSSKQDTGLYSASYRILSHVISLTMIFNTALYPVIARYASGKDTRLTQLVSYVMRLLVTFYGPVALLGMGLAAPFLHLLFGRSFEVGEAALQILMIASLFTIMNMVFNQVCLALHRQRALATILFMQLTLDVALNYFWIPRHGRAGAASAKLAAECLGTGSFFYVLRQANQIKLRTIFKPFPALACMGGALLVFRDFKVSAWLTLVSCATLYIIALLLFHAASREDFQFLRKLFYKRAA